MATGNRWQRRRGHYGVCYNTDFPVRFVSVLPAARGKAMHTYLTSKIDVAHPHIKDDDLRFLVSMISRTGVPDVSFMSAPHKLTDAPLLMIICVFLVSVTDVK